jgi:hypothetical protein
MKQQNVNKLLLYLLLLSSPACLHAETIQDDIEYTDSVTTTVTEDTIVPFTPYVAAPAYKDRKFDDSFRKKYKDEDFVYEKKPGVKTLWERFWEAVGRFFDWLFSSGGKQESSIFPIVKLVLAVVVILFVIYMIVRAILNKEGMWIFGRSRKKITAQDSTGEDIHEMDFQKLTAETKLTGNYKLAVRYYFLWLLKKMADREIIDWHWDKTNSDYLYEIKNSDLKKDFEYLTYVYDYSWYGDFPLDEKAFAKAEKAFMKTLNTL